MGIIKPRGRRLVLFVWMMTAYLSFSYVSCVTVTVKREKLDTFTNHHNTLCNDGLLGNVCKNKSADTGKNTTTNVCSCVCKYSSSTFLESNLRCVGNSKLRNRTSTLQTPWNYFLLDDNGLGNPIRVLNISLSNLDIIPFKINQDIKQITSCDPYEVEIANKSHDAWSSIKTKLSNISVDLANIRRAGDGSVTFLNLTWKPDSINFAGKVMRIRIRCKAKRSNGKSVTVDDFIVFKVAGSLQVEFPTSVSSTSTLQSSSSLSSSNGLMTSQAATTTVKTTTLKTTTYQSEYSINTTPTVMVSSTLQSIQPSSTVESFSTKLLSSGSRNTFNPVSSTVTWNTTSMPDKQTESSSLAKTVTGVVVGVIIALILILLIIYILRKRKLKQTLASGGGFTIKHNSRNVMLQQIPTLSNPVYEDGTYENPQDIGKKRESGIKSIQSAMYDQCIVVDNPSNRQEVPSVYDNVDKKDEHTYQDLDPNKRDPLSKYQSLVKPENEYIKVPGKTANAPVYSLPNDGPQTTTEPVYNMLKEPTKSEPVYNVLEQSGDVDGKREALYSVMEHE